MIAQFDRWRAELRSLRSSCERAINERRVLNSAEVGSNLIEVHREFEDENNHHLERSLFYSALVCRKMLEASRWEPNLRDAPDGLPTRNLAETASEKEWTFSGMNGDKVVWGTKQLCDQIIHSHTISWANQPVNEDFVGFWLASDRKKGSGPVFVFWHELFEMISFFAPLSGTRNTKV